MISCILWREFWINLVLVVRSRGGRSSLVDEHPSSRPAVEDRPNARRTVRHEHEPHYPPRVQLMRSPWRLDYYPFAGTLIMYRTCFNHLLRFFYFVRDDTAGDV